MIRSGTLYWFAEERTMRFDADDLLYLDSQTAMLRPLSGVQRLPDCRQAKWRNIADFRWLALHIHRQGRFEMNSNCWTMVALPALLAGCNSPDTSTAAAPVNSNAFEEAVLSGAGQAPSQSAAAELKAADGKPVGRARATVNDGRVMLSLQVEGLPPGEHGVHVHMTGKCDAPKFESAGAHWNPANTKHGLEAPGGQHAGDMPNLVVDANGRGSISYELKGATFAGLMDGDGSAMVVHASADDQKTDPSGNSGDRIACGIFNVV